jgi:hypothetical protein
LIWKKKSVWAQSRLVGPTSSFALLLPTEQTIISETALVPSSDIALTDEFEFKEEKVPRHLFKIRLWNEQGPIGQKLQF